MNFSICFSLSIFFSVCFTALIVFLKRLETSLTNIRKSVRDAFKISAFASKQIIISISN